MRHDARWHVALPISAQPLPHVLRARLEMRGTEARELALRKSVEAAVTAYDAQRRPATAAVVEANRRGGPNEVLVSQTVKDLVAGSPLTFEDRGEHELKGVPDRWRLYRVMP